ncbi:MAG: STAS domain-containing protein [Spongiibacteraceae bacterium]
MKSGKILVANQDGAFVIKMEGDVRLTVCTALDDFLDDMFSVNGFASVVIDLVSATNIDSTTLGLLAKLAVKAKAGFGLVPVIVSSNPDINRVLSSMGFENVFDIRNELCCDEKDLAELPISEGSEEEVKQRVIEAHRVLMGLSDSNHAKFCELVSHLETQCGP